jgi:hypothetical protein
MFESVGVTRHICEHPESIIVMLAIWSVASLVVVGKVVGVNPTVMSVSLRRRCHTASRARTLGARGDPES